MLDLHLSSSLRSLHDGKARGTSFAFATKAGSLLRLAAALALGNVANSLFAQAPIRDRKESRGEIAFSNLYPFDSASGMQKRDRSPASIERDRASRDEIMQRRENDKGGTDKARNEQTKPRLSSAQQAETSPFEIFKASLPTVSLYELADGTPQLAPVENATKVTYWIVEQDVLLNEFELRFFYSQADALKQRTVGNNKALFTHSFTSADGKAPASPRKLGGMIEAGRIVRWTPGSTLTYCVLKWTFGGNTDQYNAVCKQMAAATKAWSNACNIKFQHRSELDTVAKHTTFPVDAQKQRQVLFVVAHYAGMDAVASAFFPNDSIDERLLLINPNQFYGGKFSEVGVLRHELGHVLGFRHEHINPNAPVWESAFCKGESNADSKALGKPLYDRQSVMHYPCDATDSAALPANWAMELTPGDIDGAQFVYGAPGTKAPSADPKLFRDFDAKP